MNAVTRKSDAWLQQHRATIGGSNSAAAVGLHKFKTPLALYAEIVLGQAEDLEGNPDALRGILLEPVARQRLSDVLNLEVIAHDQDEFIYNSKYPYAHALPDGYVIFDGARIPVEIKVPRPENWRLLDEEIPDFISCQAVHNAAVIGAPALLLACLCPATMQLKRQLYEPPPETVDALMEAEARFWNEHIVPRVPPAPTNHNDLKLRWPDHAAGKWIRASDRISEAHVDLMRSKAEAKILEERIDSLNFTIKEFMEDNETLIDTMGITLATWKSHIDTRLDSSKLKAGHPDVWKQYACESSVRTFLSKKLRGH